MRDWREDYIVCEHVAASDGSTDGTRHSGVRVCCAACYEIQDENGTPLMLYSDKVEREERGNLTVMRLKALLEVSDGR